MNRAVTLIVLMIVTFAVISSVPIPEGTPEPTAVPEGTPEPTAVPEGAPEPTAVPEGTPEPTATAEPPQFVQSEIPSGEKNVEKRSAEGYEKF
ncbi:Uncharacterised protein g5252 [Pycnogonum litorale]